MQISMYICISRRCNILHIYIYIYIQYIYIYIYMYIIYYV